MTEYRYTVVFERAEEGGWLAHVPALNGITTQGDTLDNARAMAVDAISGYIECLRADGLPIPNEQDPKQLVVQTLAVAV